VGVQESREEMINVTHQVPVEAPDQQQYVLDIIKPIEQPKEET
jgi:hypothetical protein